MLNKYYFIFIGLWFLTSVCAGIILPCLGIEAPYTTQAYYWVNNFIEGYEEFCWAMLVFLLEAPALTILIFCYGLRQVSITRAAKICLSSVAVSSLLGLMGLIELTGNNIFSRIVKMLITGLDWPGALAFFFLMGYSLVVSIVILIKSNGIGRDYV